MDADEALKIISKYGSVRERPKNHSSDDQAWRRTFSITELRPARLPAGDLAVSGIKEDGGSRSSSVDIWTTRVGDSLVVSGISYNFYGSLSRDLRLGVPTEEFEWMANNGSWKSFFYGPDRSVADQQVLHDLDRCNAPTEASHWGSGYSPRCDLKTFPSGGFIYAIDYNNGFSSVELRDADIGRERLKGLQA